MKGEQTAGRKRVKRDILFGVGRQREGRKGVGEGEVENKDVV